MNKKTVAALITLSCIIFLSQVSIIQTIVLGHARDALSRFIPQDTVMSGKVIAQGTIREDDPGQDALHRASGTVTIEYSGKEYFVRLGEDLNSTPGPDYHVYLSDSLNINDEASFLAAKQIELGRLTRGKGASAYKIEKVTNSDVSITIWCKAFNEFIGSANVLLK